MKKKAEKIKRVICINLMVMVAFLTVLELATRTISLVSGKGFTLSIHEVDPQNKKVSDIYQWHPFVGFTFTPNNRFVGSHPYQKNSAEIFVDKHGFLAGDNNLLIPKGDDEIRIATIGGSTTANLNLPFDRNWPGRLGNILQQKFPDKKITVINAGTPGFDTAQSIGNLALRVMPFAPDIVIIYHAYNDFKAIGGNKTFTPDYSHIHKTPYGFFKQPDIWTRLLRKSMFYVRNRNLVREFKKNRIEIGNKDKKRLPYIPPEAEKTFTQHIEALVSIAESGGASVILSSFATLHDPDINWNSQAEAMKQLTPFQVMNLKSLYYFTSGLTIEAIFEAFNRYNRVLLDVARDRKTGWVDNADLVPHEDQYFVDRVHFSTAGAGLMAENFAVCAEKIIRDRLRSDGS